MLCCLKTKKPHKSRPELFRGCWAGAWGSPSSLQNLGKTLSPGQDPQSMHLWILLKIRTMSAPSCMTPPIPQIFLRATRSTSTISLHMLLGPEIGISWSPKEKTALGRVLSSRTIFFSISLFSLLQPNQICSWQPLSNE